MGQYYTPVLIRDNSEEIIRFNSWDYGNGLKLLEHSYIGNSFVETVAMQLYQNPARLAWVGDYAGDYLEEFSEKKDTLSEFVEIESIESPKYFKTPKYDITRNILMLTIYNHTKKQYVDMYNYICFNSYMDGKWATCLHPLPLLTAVGNGYGGGDYHDCYPDYDKVGIWAGDLIEIAPFSLEKSENYTDITSQLHWKLECQL